LEYAISIESDARWGRSGRL